MRVNHSDGGDGAAVDGADPLTAILTKSKSYRKCNDTVRISGTNAVAIDISFQRTIRVPDNQDKSYLPPSLGTFPLYSVTNFRKTLPAEMTKKGGLFFPMYRKPHLHLIGRLHLPALEREAMWINFSATKPFAIKIFLGGVNAVSGEPVNDNPATTLHRLNKLAKHQSIQDYVVAPNQLWLDGIASEQGSVRQFVAMPLGRGYSVEAQVTGQEVTGGIQFLVVPSIQGPPLSQGPHQAGTISITVRTLTGKAVQVYNLPPNYTVGELKDHIQSCEGIPPEQQRLICDGKQLEDLRTLSDHGIVDVSVLARVQRRDLIRTQGATMLLVLKLRGGGGGPTPEESQLGVAPGGLIKQCIIEDPYPASKWDLDRAISFNVQILNSQLFQQVTGVIPPASPISAQTYASRGLPFFDIYNEQSQVQGDFRAIKSVVAMDVEKVGKEYQEGNKDKINNTADEQPIGNSVVLLNPDGTHHSFKPVSVLKAELKRMNYAQF
ncbi:MAG: hypothetical protein LQ338_005682 [Usnochroma carphineum]|nr:MAG: hypothetical protein LQ338_005682 [Usnochroma carphineum]